MIFYDYDDYDDGDDYDDYDDDDDYDDFNDDDMQTHLVSSP